MAARLAALAAVAVISVSTASMAEGEVPPTPAGFAAPTTSLMREGIFAKLKYDLEYFSGVLGLSRQGRRDTRLGAEEWSRELRRATTNFPVLERLFRERPEYEAKGRALSLPPRDDVHRVYANLIALLNMLQAYDRGDFSRVLATGERVVVGAKTDLGIVRSDDARYYLNLYREYFWFMAAAHYRLGHDREAIAWLSRIDTDTNVKALREELAKVDTRSTAERLAALSSRAVAVLPAADRQPGADTAWLGHGFAEVLTTDLQRYTSLNVTERANVDKVVREVQLAQAGLTEEKNAQKLGGLLAAGSLVRGAYVVSGDELQLSLELVDADDGRVLARAEAAAAKAAPFAAGRDALLGLLREAGWLSDDGAADLRAARPPSADTIRALLEARLLLASQSAQARALYQRAVKEDPAYAQAFEDVKRQFSGVTPLVAVMRFVNAGNRDDEEWLATGAAEALNTDLPTLGFTLVERTQLARVVQQEQLGRVLEQRAAAEVAKKLGADFVVLGSVLPTGREVRVDCRFVDIGTGLVVQTFSASGRTEAYGQVLAALEQQIARRFNTRLNPEDLAKLTGARLSRDEFERMAREKHLADQLARAQDAEAERASFRAPTWLAGAGVIAGAGLAVTGFLLAGQSSATTAYIEGLQKFASSPEDASALATARAQATTVTTAWTAAGVGGVVLATGSAAVLAWRALAATPPSSLAGPVARGQPATLSPTLTFAPGLVGLGATGRF